MKMKKVLAMLLAVLMIVTATVAGTVAWLTTSTQEVENTFTTSDIDITLSESDADGDDNADVNDYQMVPGAPISKDPKVTVLADSEECYVFVKITEGNFIDHLTYVIAEGWSKLEDGVYYREVSKNSTDDQEFPVLKDNQVLVSSEMTKAEMNAIETANKEPTLNIQAYAIQKLGFGSVAAAWEEAQKLP